MPRPTIGQFPAVRLRRSRRTPALRRLIAEAELSVRDLIYPVFVLEGKGKSEPVDSMPGVSRRSLDRLIPHLEEAHGLGVATVALFPVIDESKKTINGAECNNSEGLVQTAVRAIKEALPEISVITDVALDPYTTHGQDGIIDDSGYVVNDETVAMLVKQAVSHAIAGADIVAPSDMMDGRIAAIRSALEANDHRNTLIMSYAAKFASAFYGPFRDAVGSAKNLAGADKSTYQVASTNSNEALREAAMDVHEGADFVMVKPAMPYLDVVRRVSQELQVPTFAYQVSGEYAMLKAAAEKGWLNERDTVMESLLCIKRAGADGILSYFALDVARWLAE